MKNLTAVEWLQEAITKKLNNELGPYFIDLFDNAKAMEKEQIIQAYYQNGWNDNDNEHNAEQYYNETYKQTL